jgi:hypothetical protein
MLDVGCWCLVLIGYNQLLLLMVNGVVVVVVVVLVSSVLVFFAFDLHDPVKCEKVGVGGYRRFFEYSSYVIFVKMYSHVCVIIFSNILV